MKKKNKKIKKNTKARKLKLAEQSKAKTTSRLFSIAVLAIIGYAIYPDLHAESIESRYLTDEELLQLNEMDEELEQLEAKYPKQKQIIICWNAEKQRLVPTYMGCK